MRQIPSENKRIRGRGAVARRGISPRARRRKRRAIFFYCFTFLFVIAAAVVLSLTVLFRIDTIEVNNTSRYSEQEILKACGIEEGQNLFLADTQTAARNIDQKLPYSGGVRVSRKLPNSLVVTVEEPVVSMAFEQDGQYVVVSKENKILEIVSKAPEGVQLITGMKLQKPASGKKYQPADEKTEEAFLQLQEALNAASLDHITKIDVTDIYKMTVEYDGRIQILFGNVNDLSLKISSAKKIILEELGEDEQGELDVSLTRDLKKAYYLPKELSSAEATSKPDATAKPENSGENTPGENIPEEPSSSSESSSHSSDTSQSSSESKSE